MRIGVFGGRRLGIVDGDWVIDVTDLVPESTGVEGPLHWFITSEWDRRFNRQALGEWRPRLPARDVEWERPLDSFVSCDSWMDSSNAVTGAAPADRLGIVVAAEAYRLQTDLLDEYIFGFARLEPIEAGGKARFVLARTPLVTDAEGIDERLIEEAWSSLGCASRQRRLKPGEVIAGPAVPGDIQYAL